MSAQQDFSYNYTTLSALPEIVSFATDARQRAQAGAVAGALASSPAKSPKNKLIISASERDANAATDNKIATTLGSIAVSIQRQHEKERRISDINDLRGTITVPVASSHSHHHAKQQRSNGGEQPMRHFDRSVSLEVRRLLSQQGARNKSPQRKHGQQQDKHVLPAAEAQQAFGHRQQDVPAIPPRPSSGSTYPSRPSTSGGVPSPPQHQQHQKPRQHRSQNDTDSNYSSASGSRWDTAATETGSTALVYKSAIGESGAAVAVAHGVASSSSAQQRQALAAMLAGAASREDAERLLHESSADFLEALLSQQGPPNAAAATDEDLDEALRMRQISSPSVIAQQPSKHTASIKNALSLTETMPTSTTTAAVAGRTQSTRREKMSLFQNRAFENPRNSRSTPMLVATKRHERQQHQQQQKLNATMDQQASSSSNWNAANKSRFVQDALESTRTAALAVHARDAESPVTRRRRRYEMLRSANLGVGVPGGTVSSSTAAASTTTAAAGGGEAPVEYKTPSAAQYTYVRTFQAEPAPRAAVEESALGTKRSLLDANNRGGVGVPRDDGIFPCEHAGRAVDELLHPVQRYRRGSAGLLQQPEHRAAVVAVADACIQPHVIKDDEGLAVIGEFPTISVAGTGFRGNGRQLEAALQRYRVQVTKQMRDFWAKRPSPPRRASLIEHEVKRARAGIIGHGASARSASSSTPPTSARQQRRQPSPVPAEPAPAPAPAATT